MIRAKHIIYSRLEPAYSPKNDSGYQVAFSSPNLTPSSLDEVIRRVRCYDYQEDMGLKRYQFFTIPGNLVAIVLSTPIKAHKEIIDKDERDGAFIAHAILLSSEDFQGIDNDPFAVFDGIAHIFATSVEQLRNYIKENSPPDMLKLVSRNAIDTPYNWSMEQWVKVHDLGVSASETFTNSTRTLFLQSRMSQNIVHWIRTALFLIPPQTRLDCSFDTHVDGCQPQSGRYWVIGGSHPSESGFVTLNLDQPNLDVVYQLVRVLETPYRNWLAAAEKQKIPLTRVFEQIPSAHIIARALGEGTALPEIALNHDTAVAFYAANKGRLNQQLKQALVKVLNEKISSQILPDLTDYLSVPVYVSVAAQEYITAEALAPIVFQWIVDRSPTIKAWKDVLNFAQVAEHAPLQVLASYQLQTWLAPVTNRLNNIDAIRRRAVQKLHQANDYKVSVKALMKVVSPRWLITKETAESIARLCDSTILEKISDAEFAELVKDIIENGGGISLSTDFALRAKSISVKKAVRQLKKVTQDDNAVSPQFVTVVNKLDG
jgi:hypothetical protein